MKKNYSCHFKAATAPSVQPLNNIDIILSGCFVKPYNFHIMIMFLLFDLWVKQLGNMASSNVLSSLCECNDIQSCNYIALLNT